MNLHTKLKYFLQLNQQQWFNAEKISELQNTRLRKLIRHSYDNVPYYKRIFDENGIHPNDISGVDELHKIPMLNKRTLQKEPPTDFLAQNIKPDQFIIRKTSGSSGLQLNIYHTRNELIFGELTKLRASIANGVRPWHKRAVIQGDIRVPKTTSRTGYMKRTLQIPTSQNVQEQIDTLLNFKPYVIRGYSKNLNIIAHTIKKLNIKGISPKFVFGFAEVLDDETRANINDVFGVKMVDLYGAMEADCIAWECPEHCGYHLNTDTLIIEFIRNGNYAKPGESGHIVVTPLYRYGMPLLRYNLGDIGTPIDTKCTCGKGLPLMKSIQGRADDLITMPSGRIITAINTFANIIEGQPNVVQFLIIQEDYDLITVKLVLDKGNGQEESLKVKKGIEDLTLNEATVNVEIVNQIDRNGDKFRRIISKVPVKF